MGEVVEVVVGVVVVVGDDVVGDEVDEEVVHGDDEVDV